MRIDRPLMGATMWNNTPSEPDRMERRMAECLVHRQVPWRAIGYVATRTPARAAEARATLARFSQGIAVRTKHLKEARYPRGSRQPPRLGRGGAGQHGEQGESDGQGHRSAVPPQVPGHVPGLRTGR
ncbi:MAG: DarT ssDNA thymidine ADP-ribosyltransferase family protein [Pseudonocardiaceae bacterium]